MSGIAATTAYGVRTSVAPHPLTQVAVHAAWKEALRSLQGQAADCGHSSPKIDVTRLQDSIRTFLKKMFLVQKHFLIDRTDREDLEKVLPHYTFEEFEKANRRIHFKIISVATGRGSLEFVLHLPMNAEPSDDMTSFSGDVPIKVKIIFQRNAAEDLMLRTVQCTVFATEYMLYSA